MISFEIDDNMEKKLNIWRNTIKNDPRTIGKPEKFVFYMIGQSMICEVIKGPHKIDLTEIESG
jgi:hypothetical protein